METPNTVDMVTFEILRHRLEEVVAEMYHTIVHVSGNPTLYEAGDHQEAIMDVHGNTVMSGGGVTEWTTCLEGGTKYLIDLFQENPGFKDGEQWLHNYSYGAAVHGLDVQVHSPVFWEGRHIAWVVTAGHQADVGGPFPGSMSGSARDIYAEGLLLKGLRFAGEGGKVNRDVEESLRALLHAPDAVMLGLYASIAANNIARGRLYECIRRYGLETLLQFFEQIHDHSEKLLKAKLRSIPDGMWSAEQFCESLVENEPYVRVAVTAIKQDDELTLDFSASSPQSIGPQNIGRVGAMSNAHCACLALLCYDIPWSSGAWRSIEFVMPEGLCINPRFPAPTALNTPTGAGYLTITAVYEALSKMLLCSPEMRHEAFASSCPAGNWPLLYGKDHEGKFFNVFLMDGVCGGQGATEYKTGDNCWGNMWGPKVQVCNIETNENSFPMLYLMRRQVPDSGGAGKWRGGNGMMLAFVPWGNLDRKLEIQSVAMGVEPRLGYGLAGGYPPSNVTSRVLRNSNFWELVRGGSLPSTIQELRGEKLQARPGGVYTLGENDVYVVSPAGAGGGGYGDPLDRDPELVGKDVMEGEISFDAARQVYGVETDPQSGKVDTAATHELRSSLLGERLSDGVLKPKPLKHSGLAVSTMSIADFTVLENLLVSGEDGSRSFSCKRCRTKLGDCASGYRRLALRRTRSVAFAQAPELAPSSDQGCELREYCCPHCGVLFEVESAIPGQPVVESIRLK